MKKRRTLKQQPSLKVKRKLTFAYATAGFAIAAIVGVGLFFYLNVGNATSSLAKSKKTQEYTSSGQKNWHDDSSWVKSGSLMDTNPGDNLNYDSVKIYGYINRIGGLKVRGNTQLIIYDTLWITGTLTLSGKGSVIIEDKGVLVVDGNYITKGRTRIHNKGKLVIKQDLQTSGSTEVINNKDFYVFGSVSRKRKSTYNSVKNVSNASIYNQDILEGSDSKLYTFATGANFTLPTTLTYLYARLEGSSVIVDWESARESNNEFFTVERSTVGTNFEKITTVAGAGNSHRPVKYSYTDYEPLPGISYYRIRQTNYDGQSQVFNTVAVFTTIALKAE